MDKSQALVWFVQDRVLADYYLSSSRTHDLLDLSPLFSYEEGDHTFEFRPASFLPSGTKMVTSGDPESSPEYRFLSYSTSSLIK